MELNDFTALAEQDRSVDIDHLAFSFKLTELRHAHKADLSSFKWQRLPEANYRRIKNPEKRQHALEAYQQAFHDVMIDRLSVFLFHVLGMTTGHYRGKGFHFYEDSCVLFDKTGTNVMGMLGIGGNRDTVYLQISGAGCKYLFTHTDCFRLHWWLTKILSVYTLARLDLCVDDFSGVFDAKYAESCFYEGAFRTSNRGQGPRMNPHKQVDQAGNLYEEATLIGSRSSSVYWRIYNKKFEQKITHPDIVWYRNEVELKKCSVDALLKPAASFSGLCAFAASIEPTDGVCIKRIAKKSILDLASRVAWLRRQCSKSITKVVQSCNGDIEKAMGLIIQPDSPNDDVIKYGMNKDDIGIPNSYLRLINYCLE